MTLNQLATKVYQLLRWFNTSSNGDITSVKIPSNIIVGDGVSKITVSDIAPSNPRVGDLWIDTN